MADDALLWVVQKAFIEKDGKVLVIHDPVEGLDFPGGKIQLGEGVDGDRQSLARSLEREVMEETGLEITVGEPFAVSYHEFSKSDPRSTNGLYLTCFGCRYVDGEVVLSHEHDNFCWVDEDDYLEVDDGTSYFDLLKKYFEIYKRKGIR